MSSDLQPNNNSKSAQTAAAQPRFKRFVAQQIEKVTDRVWTLLFSAFAVAIAAIIPKFSKFVSGIRVPLWAFVLVSVPAIFGVVTLTRSILLRRRQFYITLDPERSFCQETIHGSAPVLYFRFFGTFTNAAPVDELVMYAYVKGTRCLSHFIDPIGIPPETALLDVDAQFICTLPKHADFTSSFTATFIFVNAIGLKHRQRFSVMVYPKPPVSPLQQVSEK